jgi:F-type H+-transporting ATPase subunit b
MNVLFTALLSEGSIIDLDGTFWLQLGLFAVAFLALRPLIFRPMVALFEARENAIEGAKLEALRLQDEAEAESQEFDDEMRRLRLRAGEERDRLRAEGKRLEKAVLDHVREDSDKQLSEADAQLATEAAKLREEMKTTVPALARQIASKLLSREVQQ